MATTSEGHSWQLRLSQGEKDISKVEPSVSSAPLHSAQAYCKGPPFHCMLGVGGEHDGITVSLTGSGIPKWWEGWTTGMRTNLESPTPPVQCSTPARSSHESIYNRTATMAFEHHCNVWTSLKICSTGENSPHCHRQLFWSTAVGEPQ